MADLVEHLTYIHHWAAAMARCEDYPDQPDLADRPGGAALRSSYQEAALDLLDTVTALDPDAPARTLLETGTVAFWHRRQVHETLVHLWDLRTAAGQALIVDPALWADTVDEAVTVMHPRQLRLGRAAPAPVRLLVVADDDARSWELPRVPTSPVTPAATVTGPSESLALLLWGRRRLDHPLLRVDGDPAALQDVLAARFLP